MFSSEGPERGERRGLTACGALCVAGTLGPATGDMRLQWVGVLGYAVLLPLAALLLARHFASRERRSDMRIRPHIGLDDVRFGMSSREQVRARPGRPDRRSIDEGGEGPIEAWCYRAKGIHAHFVAGVDWRLEPLEVTSPEAELEGRRVIGRSVSDIETWLAGRRVDWPADPTDPASIEEWATYLWFEDGVLESVQWWVPLGEDDAEIWPK